MARNPGQLAQHLEHCYAEVECAGYARWKRQRPEGAELGGLDDDPLAPAPSFSDITPPTARQAKGWRQEEWRSGGNKREQHPADWTVLPDGRWESPKGRVFNPDTEMAQRVIRRRIALGLPITAVDGKYDLGAVAELIEQHAAKAGTSGHDWLQAVVRTATELEQRAWTQQPAVVETPVPAPRRLRTAGKRRDHPEQQALFDLADLLDGARPALAVAS